MLYDPKWERPAPNTLEDLIAWLETKDPKKRYDYGDAHTCLIAEYRRARGLVPVVIYDVKSELGIDWYNIANPGGISSFGNALKAARAIVTKKAKV